MTQATPAVTLHAYLDSSWTDISSYQCGQIGPVWWGISGNKLIDFVASTGTMQFILDNTSCKFSPNHGDVISPDWKKGAAVKLTITYAGQSRIWCGKIDDFSFETDVVHNGNKVTVYVADWMNNAAQYPINYPAVQVNQTADQAVGTIIAAMPTAPLAQSLAVGVNTFPFVFDTATDFTYALTEFSKLCLSELAYLYIRKDSTYGETLVLENADSRKSPTPVSIPVAGGGTEAFTSYDDAGSYETSYGDNVVNDIRFRYIPRRYVANDTYPIGGAGAPCWDTGYDSAGNKAGTIKILAGETIIISCQYNTISPNYLFTNKGSSTGKILSAPLLGTGGTTALTYFLNSKSDGTGTALTTDLSVISEIERVDHFEIHLKNNGATDGFLSAFLWGKDLFVSDPDVQTPAIQDATSIAVNDYQSLNFDQIYQVSSVAGTVFANNILGSYSTPRSELNRINYNANRSSKNMMQFLSLDIGDYFPARVTDKAIAGNFFIQNMSFTIDPGKIINYSIGVTRALEPVLVSFEKSYTRTAPNDGLRTDADGIHLTDGILGPIDYENTIWVGWQNTNVTVRIDLGIQRFLSYARFHFTSVHSEDIWSPDQVIISGSNNDSSYSILGTFVKTTDWYNADGFLSWSSNLILAGNYRYIKFVFTYQVKRLLISEIEVYGL
jgi:hypothetical protein